MGTKSGQGAAARLAKLSGLAYGRGSVVALLLVAMLLGVACASSSSVATRPSPSPPPKEPGPRGYATMVDTPAGVVLIGGESAGPRLGGRSFSDVWGYDPARGWTLVAPDQPAVGLVADGVGYHPPTGAFVYLDLGATVWRLDAGRTTWTKQATSGPSSTHGIRFVYDARADRFVTFGGDVFRTSRYFDDTWEYDLAHDKWTKRVPGISPPGRSYYAIAYDAKASRLVMFGGVTSSSELGDTWTYSYTANTWTRVATRISPSPRHYSAMVYDPVRYRMLLFGGADDSETVQGDTWAFDLGTNTWSQIHESGSAPSARAWHAMAFDIESGKAFLYGGGPNRGAFTTELWTLDSRTDTWARVA